jgi:1-acyl-sn-glycerol-3-phosphate acyltransferase
MRYPGTAVIEFLPVIPPGLPRKVFFERMKNAIEAGSERLAQEALALDPSLRRS